jgi:hypothetical protein
MAICKHGAMVEGLRSGAPVKHFWLVLAVIAVIGCFGLLAILVSE